MTVPTPHEIARPPWIGDHYPTRAAERTDLAVHIIGLAFALFGGGVLLGLAFGLGSLPQVASVSIYVTAFIAMLALSTAYNFSTPKLRPLLRRLDHAGIFVMIAGSYTPFTTLRLHGDWAIGMTAAVWAIAAVGVVGKLFFRGLGQSFWIGIYLALGWIALIAIKPLFDSVSLVPLLLLALGGVVYSTGAVFYVMKKLRFRRAIWHGHVVAGSVLQFVAVLVGVVLAPGSS
ncbi:MAG TPA: hemolysin III family protein [Caulobacteraceae bacterium]|jgi:hemolysin III